MIPFSYIRSTGLNLFAHQHPVHTLFTWWNFPVTCTKLDWLWVSEFCSVWNWIFREPSPIARHTFPGQRERERLVRLVSHMIWRFFLLLLRLAFRIISLDDDKDESTPGSRVELVLEQLATRYRRYSVIWSCHVWLNIRDSDREWARALIIQHDPVTLHAKPKH